MLNYHFTFLIEVQLIYIIYQFPVYSVMTQYFYRLLYCFGSHHKIMSVIPCAVQCILVAHLFCIVGCLSYSPDSVSHHSSPSPYLLNCSAVCDFSNLSLSVFLFTLICFIFQSPQISDIVFVFSDLISLHIFSRSIHVVVNGRISFFLMANIPLCVCMCLYLCVCPTSSLSTCLLMDTWVASISWLV